MAFNIEQFKVRLNFPNTVGQIASSGAFMIRAAQIPSSTITQVDVPYFGRQVRVAGNRTFEPWTVTVLNSEDFDVRNALERWMNTINSHRNNSGAATTGDYKANAYVDHYGKSGDGAKIAEYEFVGLFPTELSTVELAWDSNDVIEEFTCTFAFDYWQHAGVVTT